MICPVTINVAKHPVEIRDRYFSLHKIRKDNSLI